MPTVHKKPSRSKLPLLRLWVPNALTMSRVFLTVPIVATALQDQWVWGFWLVLAALMSDFLDGLAAKKLNAYTRLGAYLDPLADFLLAGAGVVVIIATEGWPWWMGVPLLLGALGIGYAKFFLPDDNLLHVLQPKVSVPLLFAIWAITVWVYATHAFGWSWWYVVASLAVVAVAARLKLHRLRAWF